MTNNVDFGDFADLVRPAKRGACRKTFSVMSGCVLTILVIGTCCMCGLMIAAGS